MSIIINTKMSFYNFDNFINILFIGFGLYAIINPNSITLEETEKSYDVKDLIKGWGIYSATIGSLLIFNKPYHKTIILRFCFILSIIWHLEIVYRNGWTLHHKHSIITNFFVFILTFYK